MRTYVAIVSTLFIAMFFSTSRAEYPTVFSTTSEQVRAFVGGSNAKMVYVNWDGNTKALHFIDFSQGSGQPTIKRIPAALEPTSPAISPCGRYVAYASAPGVYGETGTAIALRSSVYLCELIEGATPVLIAADSAYEPRFVQNATQLSIIYPTLAPDAAWEGYGKTMIATIDTSSATPQVSSTEVLFEHGSYTGGLSYDGRYLCGGGATVAMIDLHSGRTRPDTLMHPNTGQACNASISSSRIYTDRMMYLDFGSIGQSVPGINNDLPWDTWQVIVITNSDREIVEHYPVPLNPQHPYSFVDETLLPPSATTAQETFAGLRWHHPEWSNHPYFAAATINVNRKYRNPDVNSGRWANAEQQERITLLNLVTGDDHEVIRRGDYTWNTDARGLYWPSVWVEIPQGFSETNTRRATGQQRQSGSVLQFTDGVITSFAAPLHVLHFYDMSGRLLYAHNLAADQYQIKLSVLPEFRGATLMRAFSGSTSRTWKMLATR